MSDGGRYWKNREFSDSTLLLGSNQLQLEQCRVTLQEALTGTVLNGKAKPKRSPAAKTTKPRKRARGCQSQCDSSDAPADLVTATASSESDQVTEIPVHRITLCTGSEYFRTAFRTLCGDSHNAAHPTHPVIVVHEKDTEAAQGVLQYLYSKSVDTAFGTALELMRVLLVRVLQTVSMLFVHRKASVTT